MRKTNLVAARKLLTAVMLPLLSLIAFYPAASVAGMMAENGMMMGGWFMLLCMAVVVLLFVALVLAIMALVKYLLSKQ
ncbi:MAG: hypothetical protein H0V62_10405 [Gammaproteobacteria bacterium]|nr:hypothetical protein [Gammaproteobacteria bacterium]